MRAMVVPSPQDGMATVEPGEERGDRFGAKPADSLWNTAG